jgi:uncharacterized SAM-binding protein YcdF (DUF218 family)
MLLTCCSTVLVVVGFGGLYRGLRPVSLPVARPAMAAPVGALPPVAAPAPPRPAAAPAASAPLQEEYQYCRGGGGGRTAPLGRYDAVFALGAGVASPNADLAEVTVDGARLRPLAAWLAVAHHGAAPLLGFAGGRTAGPDAPSEAASMRRFVETEAFRARYGRLGRSQPARIVLEDESTTTDGNVARILDLARRHGWGRVLLVTSQYHVARTALLAELKGLSADVVAAEAIVDGALADPKVHERLCAHERSESVLATIRQERAYVSALALLRL